MLTLLCFLDVGTPVKSAIHFHRNPSSTSTVTKPSTTPTPTSNHAPSVPLASPSQRPKFTFTISPANKVNKTDPSKAKHEGKVAGEKDESIGLRGESSSSTDEGAPSEIKSPIASSDKRSEAVAKSETAQAPAKPDAKDQVSGGQKEKTKGSSDEIFPLKKEEKEKVVSPKKPRPPPLFIPRPVAQGIGTSLSTRKLLHCFKHPSYGLNIHLNILLSHVEVETCVKHTFKSFNFYRRLYGCVIALAACTQPYKFDDFQKEKA